MLCLDSGHDLSRFRTAAPGYSLAAMIGPRERMEASQWVPPWLRHQHEARYAWAAERASGLAVLDCASGDAYGSRTLLHAGAARVCAMDVALEALLDARTRHVPLALADGEKIPAADGAFDLFVSFETVEHVADDAAYVAEARRVVRRGGMFLCSTPNRRLTNAGTSISDKPFNPFHRREYTLPELRRLLERCFDTIEWLGQSVFAGAYVAALNAIGRRASGAAVRLHQLRKVAGAPFDTRRRHWPRPLPARGEPEVLIAVCR